MTTSSREQDIQDALDYLSEEILLTETRFVFVMELFLKFQVTPLCENLCWFGQHKQEAELRLSELRTCLETVVPVHKSLLAHMTVTKDIPASLCANASSVLTYLLRYVNFAESSKAFMQARAEDTPRIQEFLCNATVNMQEAIVLLQEMDVTFSSCVIMPVQRIMKYKLFLSEFNKLIADPARKRELHDAIHSVDTMLRTCNESKRHFEASTRVFQIQQQFRVKENPPLAQPRRLCVHEGYVTKHRSATSRHTSPGYAVLFSDLFVVLKLNSEGMWRKTIRMRLPAIISGGIFIAGNCTSGAHMFLQTEDELLILGCPSPSECTSWMRQLEEHVPELKKAAQRAARHRANSLAQQQQQQAGRSPTAPTSKQPQKQPAGVVPPRQPSLTPSPIVTSKQPLTPTQSQPHATTPKARQTKPEFSIDTTQQHAKTGQQLPSGARPTPPMARPVAQRGVSPPLPTGAVPQPHVPQSNVRSPGPVQSDVVYATPHTSSSTTPRSPNSAQLLIERRASQDMNAVDTSPRTPPVPVPQGREVATSTASHTNQRGSVTEVGPMTDESLSNRSTPRDVSTPTKDLLNPNSPPAVGVISFVHRRYPSSVSDASVQTPRGTTDETGDDMDHDFVPSSLERSPPTTVRVEYKRPSPRNPPHVQALLSHHTKSPRTYHLDPNSNSGRKSPGSASGSVSAMPIVRRNVPRSDSSTQTEAVDDGEDSDWGQDGVVRERKVMVAGEDDLAEEPHAHAPQPATARSSSGGVAPEDDIDGDTPDHADADPTYSPSPAHHVKTRPSSGVIPLGTDVGDDVSTLDLWDWLVGHDYSDFPHIKTVYKMRLGAATYSVSRASHGRLFSPTPTPIRHSVIHTHSTTPLSPTPQPEREPPTGRSSLQSHTHVGSARDDDDGCFAEDDDDTTTTLCCGLFDESTKGLTTTTNATVNAAPNNSRITVRRSSHSIETLRHTVGSPTPLRLSRGRILQATRRCVSDVSNTMSSSRFAVGGPGGGGGGASFVSTASDGDVFFDDRPLLDDGENDDDDSEIKFS
eukprot:PhM_4_TR14135/c4_g1_i2/m.39345